MAKLQSVSSHDPSAGITWHVFSEGRMTEDLWSALEVGNASNCFSSYDGISAEEWTMSPRLVHRPLNVPIQKGPKLERLSILMLGQDESGSRPLIFDLECLSQREWQELETAAVRLGKALEVSSFYNKRRDAERKRGERTDFVYTTKEFYTNTWHCVINEQRAAHTLPIVARVLSKVDREMEMSDAEPEPVSGFVGDPSLYKETELAAWIVGDDVIEHESVMESLILGCHESLSGADVGACKAKGRKNRRARRKAARQSPVEAIGDGDAEVVDLEAVDLEAVDLDVGDLYLQIVKILLFRRTMILRLQLRLHVMSQIYLQMR